MIFTSDEVNLENHWEITSQVISYMLFYVLNTQLR